MHTRLARAAVDEPTPESTFGLPPPHEVSSTPRPEILWARKRLLLDTQGRLAAVAVTQQAGRLLVRVVDTSTGRASWQPAAKVLTSAQAAAWIRQADFFG